MRPRECTCSSIDSGRQSRNSELPRVFLRNVEHALVRLAESAAPSKGTGIGLEEEPDELSVVTLVGEEAVVAAVFVLLDPELTAAVAVAEPVGAIISDGRS